LRRRRAFIRFSVRRLPDCGRRRFFCTCRGDLLANFPDAVCIQSDIRELTGKEVLRRLNCAIDVLVGGPSCQGFSTSGGLAKASGRDLHDPRNALFEHYLRLVKELTPTWIIFENVPGLLLYHHGEVARTITARFADIGYKIQPMILLAADFGVPQLRRRLFFVGNRTNRPVHFPLPTNGDPKLWAKFALPFAFLSRLGHKELRDLPPHVTFREACSDLPPLKEGETLHDVSYRSEPMWPYQQVMRRRSNRVTQHVASQLCESDRLAATILKPGENWTNIPEHLRPKRFTKIRSYDATTLMKRLELGRPSYTVTTKFNEASTGAFIHPTQRRTLSVREAARLQSFPDDFQFCGNHRQVREQIGNAVPPLMAFAVADAIVSSVIQDIHGVVYQSSRATYQVIADSHHDAIRLHGARKTIKTYVEPLPTLFQVDGAH